MRVVKMKKKAIIVVGEHHAGKSETINKYLKHELSNGESDRSRKHKFKVKDCEGYILSQTLEERGDPVENLKKYKDKDFIVLPTRPESESGSLFQEVYDKLKEWGFDVVVYEKKKGKDDHKKIASDISKEIQNNCMDKS